MRDLSLKSFQSARVAAAVIVSASLAGCTSPTNSYLLTGIGSNLTTADIATTTDLQLSYFNHLCRQAGLPVDPANTNTYCNLLPGDQASWSLVAAQGMNDIDRRCDAYLEWLDNKKRSREPLQKEIGSIETTTQSLIQLTVPTAANAVKAISIVGQAFQLLTDTIDNYHSRLLLEVNSSTINSIVLRGRSEFRKYIRDEKIAFNNKPDVEHALRSYLRLCLPFSIEAKINNFSTLGANGERPDQGGTLGDLPVVRKQLKSNDEFGTGGGGSTGFKPGKDFDKVFVTPANYGRRDLIALQNALCLQGQGVGSIGPKTASSIEIFEDTKLGNLSTTQDIRQPVKNNRIDGFEFDFLTAFKACNNTKYKNAFERVNFEIDSPAKTAIRLQSLIRVVNVEAGTSIAETADLDNKDLRDAIEKTRLKLNVSDYNGFSKNQVTQKLWDALFPTG